jgi:uncharacterized protein YegL
MKNLTDITFILDRSGSMSSMVNDVVGGWKTFIEKQKSEVGECVISLVQFDDQYETPFTAVPVQNVSPAIRFEPRGSTALRDAIGRTINAVGARLRSFPESERPNKVAIVVMTDGEENASHEFSQEQIKSMVKHQTEKYGWDFLFLGANIDSFHVGQSLGVAPNWITNYSYTSKGMSAGFNTVSCYTSATRGGASMTGTLSQVQAVNEAAEDENINRNLNTTSGAV